MIILAIDPGTTESAFCLYNGDPGVANAERILEAGKISNEKLLERLYCDSEEDGFDADAVVVEMVACYGMPVGREIFETVFWIGRFVEAVDSLGGPITWHRIYRKDVKLHLCQNPRAKDANISRALMDRFGDFSQGKTGKGTKKRPGPLYGFKGDMFAALAVAVTYSETILTTHPERTN